MTPAHYIRPGTTTDMPKRYIYLDTEAYRVPDDTGETQTFRLAVAQSDVFSERHQEWRTGEMQRFGNPWTLWEWVATQCRARKRTVLWTHNLGYDMRISQVLTILPELGWTFNIMRLDDDMSWAKAVRLSDKASLLFCDLHSWLPMSLEKIGKLIGMDKVDLPEDEDSDEAWYARCESDVEILGTAWCHVRDWLRLRQLGSWRPTGSAQAWSAYRHGYMTHKILIHEDQQVRDLEREAAYTGRAEAFCYGVYRNVSEYDYRHAYAHICLTANLPTVMLKWSLPRKWTTAQLSERARETGSVLLVSAQVTVPEDVTVPVLPARISQADGSDRIIWPIGSITGTWWLDELHAAVERGAARVTRIDRVTAYRARPALALWSEWVINQIDGPDALVAAIAKSWARTLVGRFGMRYPHYIDAHTVDGSNDIWAGFLLNGDQPCRPRRMMQIGDQVYVADAMVEGVDTAPQVMSYVMALTRLRLLEAIEAAGIDHTLYCDTDGLIVDQTGAQNLSTFGPVQEGWLRRKGQHQSLSILGPRQLIKDGVSHVAGLPKAGQRQPDGSYAIEWWEQMRHALESGRHDQVRIEHTTMHVSGRDGRRQKGLGNRTVPIKIGV